MKFYSKLSIKGTKRVNKPVGLRF